MASLPLCNYKALPSQYIRILELHPGPSDAPLICNLEDQLIDEQPYEALSYVWGNSTHVAFVTCIEDGNEGRLGIGKALEIALIAFRLADKKRRIWIDALCINQNDVVERQSQVRLMGTIYSKAEHVLCWIGPFDIRDEKAESRALLAIQFLREFNKSPQEYLELGRQHFHSVIDVSDTGWPVLDSWLAIKELFDLEYFHRAWIIQEVGLARHARLFWGKQELWLDWTEVAVFCSFMDANGATVINHLELKSWVANHINLVWATDSSGKSIFSFVEVLHWARVHRSTDPRDYIYALLSHPSAKHDGSLLVQPNYTIGAADAYIELASNVIERTDSLQILAFVDHHEEPGDLDLPTWVPDWHALNLVAPLRCSTKAATDTSLLISIDRSESQTVLTCRGYFIDTIQTMSNMIVPSDLIITTLEKEMQKKTPFLIDHIWKETVIDPPVLLTSMKEFIASLSLVLTGGHLNDSDSTSGEMQEQQQSDFAAMVLASEEIRGDDNSARFFTSLSPEEKSLIQTMASTGSAHQFIQDMTWTSMCRKIFRTSKGHIGLGPRIIKEGDVCVVILGAVYPMILRACGEQFQLIGPALVYGFMNGEAEDLSHSGMIVEQDFQII